MPELNIVFVNSISELTGLLCDTNKHIFAGGTDVLHPTHLNEYDKTVFVDISRIEELSYIREKDRRIMIGALSTFQTIHRSELLMNYVPSLAACCLSIGNEKTRENGTIGGSVAICSAFSDILAVLTTLKAKISIKTDQDIKEIEIDRYIRQWTKTRLDPSLLVTRISFNEPRGRWGSSFRKAGKSDPNSPAIASVAILINLDADDRIESCRISAASVAASVIRARDVEKNLKGKYPDETTLRKAAELLIPAINPISDAQATSSERKESAKTLLYEGLNECVTQAMVKEFEIEADFDTDGTDQTSSEF